MAKKPATLIEQLEQNVRSILKKKTLLKVTSIAVEPTGHELCFDVNIFGTSKFKDQTHEWSLILSVLNDRLYDIVYAAPQLNFTSKFNFSAISGHAKINTVDTFNGSARKAVKRHEAEAKTLMQMHRYANDHSTAIHNVVYQISEVVKPK